MLDHWAANMVPKSIRKGDNLEKQNCLFGGTGEVNFLAFLNDVLMIISYQALSIHLDPNLIEFENLTNCIKAD